MLKGGIGVINGCPVRIVKPSLWRDYIKNPTLLFSIKGCYTLNVQYIVNHQKQVIWTSYSHKEGVMIPVDLKKSDSMKSLLKCEIFYSIFFVYQVILHIN